MPLKLVRRKGSALWYIQGTVAGTRIRESTGIADRGLAEEKRAQREAELFRGAVYGSRAVVNFSKAVTSYMKVNKPSPETSKLVTRLHGLLGMKLLKDIKQEQVDEAIEAICPGASPQRQVRAVITPLTAILNHAAYRDWCDPPRFKRPPGAAGEKRTRWLTPDEYRRLLTSASPHLQPMIVFMACTGARMGEVLTLQWRDVDLDHGRAVLRDVKAQHGVRRNRLCDLPPAAVEALRGIEGRQGEVFRTEDGKAYSGKGGLGSRAKSAWATACRRAGFEGEWVVTRWEDGTVRNRWWQVEDVTPHVLRHTWATWHYAVHRDLLKLKLDGDWSSVTLCERYAKLAPAAMAPAIMRCWGQEVAAQAVG